MATCSKCKKHFKVPEDEQDLHDCPRCGESAVDRCPRCGGTHIRYISCGKEGYTECDECDSIHPGEGRIVKQLPICKTCHCWKCDFRGDCHCPLKSKDYPQITECDNWRAADKAGRGE